MSKTSWVILLFLAFYIALAQPGLPPCWMEAKPCAHHPHFNVNPLSDHNHDYLRMDTLSLGAVVITTSLVPVSLLILSLWLTSITRMMTGVILISKSWRLAPDPPPPRFSFPDSISHN
jgi:hypothetical protein